MADNIKITIDGENKTGNAFGGVEKNMNNLQGAAGNLHTKALQPLQNILATGLKVAAGAAVTALGGLVAVIGSSVKAAMSMEQQLADISASMGTSADETSRLKKLIGDLGFDPKLKVTATEAADAIQTLGTAGLSVDEILGGAARSTVLLANATGADFAAAASIATDAMGQFNIEAKDLAKAVNGITSTTIASKFDINDYRLALAQAGGVAATVGVEFDDFNATIAAISPYFASGSDAGTSFKTFLQRLIPVSSDAESKMMELGLVTTNYQEAAEALSRGLGYQVEPKMLSVSKAFEELKIKTGQSDAQYGAFIAQFKENQFFDAKTGKMKDMNQIIGLLNTSFADLTEEQKNETLATIFGTDAMRAAAAMAGMTEEEFTALKATMAKTDAEESAATRMNTLSGVMEILWGVVDSLKLQIGDGFIPVLRVLAENLTAQAQIHGPRVVAMFQQFAQQLSVVLQYLLAVILDGDRMNDWLTHMTPEVRSAVEATLAFWDSLKSVVSGIITFIDWIGGLKTILTALGVLMAISVVAQVVTFVAGIVSAVGAVASFVGALGAAAPALGVVLAAIGPVIAIVAALGAAAYALYTAWQNNFLGIRDITGQALDWIRGVMSNFPQTLANLRDGFFQWASNAMGAVREGFLSAQNTVRNGLDIVMDFIQRGRDERLGPFAQSLFSAGQSAFNKLGEGFRAAGGAVTGEFNRIMTDVQNQGAAFAAGAFAGRMYEAARSALLRFGEGLRSAAPNLGSDMQNALGGMINVFNGMMDGFRNHVWGVMTAIGGRIKEALASTNLRGAAEGPLWGIIDGFNAVMDGFSRHVWGVMTGIGGRISDGLASGIRGSMNRVMDALNWIASVAPGWVRDALGIHSPSTVFADIGANIMAGLAEGIAGATAMPEMALAGATGSMMAAPVTNTVNRNVSNTYNITNQGSTQSGDPIEQVRQLRGMYGGVR